MRAATNIPTNDFWCSRRCRSFPYGTAATELAIILPLLITLALGATDFGRFAYTYVAVTNAANVGATFASMNPVTSITWSKWETRIRELVAQEMGPAFDPAQITVATPVFFVESDGLKRVRVTVSYPFRTIVSWPWLPHEMVLTRSVETRVIR